MSQEPRISNLSFLIVEDSKFMRKLLTTVLYAMGARRIYEAEDGYSGLLAVHDHRPDIIISDWEMEPMNGLEFVRQMRSSPKTVNIFTDVIMLTAYTEVERIRQAREAGVTEILAKPFTPVSLFSRINAIIDKPRPYVRTRTYFGPDRRRHKPAQKGDAERRNK